MSTNRFMILNIDEITKTKTRPSSLITDLSFGMFGEILSSTNSIQSIGFQDYDHQDLE